MVNSSEDLANEGYELLKTEKFSAAESKFRKAIEINPNYSTAWVGLAQTLQDLGRLREAKQAISKAEALGDVGFAVFTMKMLLQNVPDTDEVVEVEKTPTEDEYRQSISENPKDEEALKGLSLLLFEKGQFNEAEEIIRKVIKLNKKNFDAFHTLGKYLQYMERYAEAKDILQKAAKIKGIDTYHQNMVNIRLATIIQREDSYRIMDQVTMPEIEKDPKNPQAWFARGQGFARGGFLFASEVAFRKVVELDSNHYDGKLLHSRTLLRLARNEEAEVQLRELTISHPKDWEAWAEHGFALMELNRDADALTSLDEALKLKEDDANIIYNKACALCKLGETDDALQFLERSIRLDERLKSTALNDRDLASIKELPKFQEILRLEL